MTLEELENTLPNGLRDSEIQSIVIDYIRRTITIKLCVWVGKSSDAPEMREAYREGLLLISGLQFLAMEAPCDDYPFTESKPLRVDACDMNKNLDSSLLASLSKDAFLRSLFVHEWNSFIHMAGLQADISWTGPTIYRKERKHFLSGEIIAS